MAKKKDKPETPRQAEAWGNLKSKYMAAGLCLGCAGQAAYGHQMGFSRIKPPCEADAGKRLPAEITGKHGDRGQRWLEGHFTDDPES